MRKLAILIMAVMTALSGIAPAYAFPSVGTVRVETSEQVHQVQHRRHWRGDGPRRGWHGGGPRHHWRGHGSRGVVHEGWRERGGWHGGHGGRYYGGRYYRHRRGPHPGAIIGGLAAGAIIGGALAQPRYRYVERRYVPARRHYGNAHVRWCYNRYRSYRAYDNTFKPYHGPRRQCYSPYS